MNDYSQWKEQEIILQFFKNFKGKFMDIGAYDGAINSNTRALVELGWKGVLVEPQPYVFNHLVMNCAGFDVQCVNAAVTAQGGLRRFSGIEQRGTLITKEGFWVNTITPFDLFRMFGNVDFLTIDAEGMDYEILEASLGLFDPKLICFEDDLPDSRNPDYKVSMLEMLSDFGFKRIVGTTSTIKNSANTFVARNPRL